MMMPEPRRRAPAQPRKAPPQPKAAAKPRKAAASPPQKPKAAVSQRRSRVRRRATPAAPAPVPAAPPPPVPLRAAPRASPVRQIIKIARSEVPGNTPVGLQIGELGIDIAAPPRLWVGCPTAIDASGLLRLHVADPGGPYLPLAGGTLATLTDAAGGGAGLTVSSSLGSGAGAITVTNTGTPWGTGLLINNSGYAGVSINSNGNRAIGISASTGLGIQVDISSQRLSMGPGFSAYAFSDTSADPMFSVARSEGVVTSKFSVRANAQTDIICNTDGVHVLTIRAHKSGGDAFRILGPADAAWLRVLSDGAVNIGVPTGPAVTTAGSVNAAEGFYINGVSIGTGPFLPLVGGALTTVTGLAGGGSGLTITNTNAGTTPSAIVINNNSTGRGINVANGGGGSGVYIDNWGTGNPTGLFANTRIGQGIYISLTNDNASDAMTIATVAGVTDKPAIRVSSSVSGANVFVVRTDGTVTVGNPTGTPVSGLGTINVRGGFFVNGVAIGAGGIEEPLTPGNFLRTNTGTWVEGLPLADFTQAALGGPFLTANQSITLSGDIAGSGATAITTTLPDVNANIGTFQGITVNAKGQITAAVNQSYVTTSGVTSITGTAPITVTGGTGATPDIALADTAVSPGTYQGLTIDAQGRVTGATDQGYLTGNQTIALSGDISGSGTTAITATLPNVNADVGTFNGITVNAKGQVTAATAVAGGAGTPSFAPITAGFTVPSVGGSVTLQLEQTDWCQIGAPVFVGGMTGLITAINGLAVTVLRIPGEEVTPEPDFIIQSVAPLMLAATNGAVCLTGSPPVLTRFGNAVFLVYQGANKTSITANTISIAEIPYGYRPTANVAQAIATPAITMNVQPYTTGTAVFPNEPARNNLTGVRWSLRHGTQFAASAAVSINMSWQTGDPLVAPQTVTGAAPIMLSAANGIPNLTGANPVLSRTGNVVTLTYNGAGKNTATANTISLAYIPMGFRPTANVTQAITAPAINITISVPVAGTNVFPENPGTNVTAANTQWVLRGSANIGANATVTIFMQWITDDPML